MKNNNLKNTRLDMHAGDGTFIEPTGDDDGFEANNTVMYGEEQDVDDL